MSKITREDRERVNRSLCSTHGGLNDALKWTDERKEPERLEEESQLLKKYAILYLTSATACECVSQRKVLQDNTKYCSSD